MSNNEYVDGPRVAADILAKMSSKNRSRIVKAIEARHPQLANRISAKLFDFESLLELTPQSIQLVLKEVEDRDIVLSLKAASNELIEMLLSNLSERKRMIIEDEFESLPPIRLTQVEEAKRRILEKTEELRTRGLIRSSTDNEVWV